MTIHKENALRITHRLHLDLEEAYGDRLKGVYLYGSHARDEATDDSDIDVAIVLAGAVNNAAETDRISGLLSDICLRENAFISVFFLSEKEWSEQPYAIHRSIAREGVPA